MTVDAAIPGRGEPTGPAHRGRGARPDAVLGAGLRGLALAEAERSLEVARLCATVQLTLGVLSRFFSVSAVPALIGFHLAVVVFLLTSVSYIVLAGWPTRSFPDVAARDRLVLWAAMGSAVSVALRSAGNPADPPSRWALPWCLAVVAVLTVLSTTRQPSIRPLARTRVVAARRWADWAAVGAFVAAVWRTRSAYGDVPRVELTVLGLVAAAAAVVTLMVARGTAPVTRPLLTIGLGLATAALAAGGGGSHVTATRATTGLLLAVTLTRPLDLRATVGLVRRATSPRVASVRRRVGRVAAWSGGSAGAWFAPGSPACRGSMSRGERRGAAVIVLASIAALTIRLLWALHVGWEPTGHAATIMARAWDVGTSNTPLVGTGTSLGASGGASHPSALLFDLLAPFVRILGLRHGAYVGSAVIHLVVWLVGVWAAFRAGGRAIALLAWVAGGTVLATAALGITFDPNNVSLTLGAIITAFLASWAAASGVPRAWPWAVAAGSLCAGAYLPHGLLVVGPVLWSGLVTLRLRQTTTDPAPRRSAARSLLVGLIVGAAAWAQPIVDAVVHAGGNLKALYDVVTAPRPPVGSAGIWEGAGWLTALPLRWARITSTFAEEGTARQFLGGSALVGIGVAAVIAVCWWATRRTTSRSEWHLRLMTVLLYAGALVNLTQLPKTGIRTYVLVWMIPAAICIWFTVFGMVATQVKARVHIAPRPARAVRVLAMAGAVVLVVGVAADLPPNIAALKGQAFDIDAAVTPVVEQLRQRTSGDEEVLVLGMDTLLTQVVSDTITSNLIVSGRPVRVEPGFIRYYGERRAIDPGWAGRSLWVTDGTAPFRPPGRLVASVTQPGWREERFDAATALVKRWAERHPELTLSEQGANELPRYLAGWTGDDACRIAKDVESGKMDIAELPAGAIAWLVVDDRVEGGSLPTALRREIDGLVGQAPIQVWEMPPVSADLTQSARLVRDGTVCSP